ncbi:MAG: anti-sigma factor family protein [Actinocrinis sp.]
MGRFSEHLGARLGALVDGELAHDDRDRALAHLAGCAQCRTLVEAERTLKTQLDAMPMPEPSARLMAALFQIPQTERPPEPPAGSPPQVGGFLGRSSAFLPEFAVGLRPIGELPDEHESGLGEPGAVSRIANPIRRGGSISLVEPSFLSRPFPTSR